MHGSVCVAVRLLSALPFMRLHLSRCCCNASWSSTGELVAVMAVTGEMDGAVIVAASVDEDGERLAEGCTARGGAPTGLAMSGTGRL